MKTCDEFIIGPETEVTYFLIPGKETKPTVKFIIAKMKPEVVCCNDQENPLIINFLGSEIKLYSKIKMSQFDRKMIDCIHGFGGAICHLWSVGLKSFCCLLKIIDKTGGSIS